MAGRNWLLSKDTTTAGLGVDYGNGNDQHGPIGTWSGWTYRYFAQFGVDLSGMASIISATLHVRSTTQVHVGFGSVPNVVATRVTSNWVGSGGAEGSWVATANPKNSTQPSVTTTGQTTTQFATTNNTWGSIDVTAIAQAWLSGSTNYGIRLSSANEANGTNTFEISAFASAYDAYISVAYNPTVAPPTNQAPSAINMWPITGNVPDLTYQTGLGGGTPFPTFLWNFSDPDIGDTQSAYRVVIYLDAAGAQGGLWYDSGQTSGANTTFAAGLAFVEGGYYWWAVQVWDNQGLGSALSAAQRIRIRWGAAEYRVDMGATPVTWSITGLTTTGSAVVEYNSSSDATDPGAGLGAWKTDLAQVTKQRYMHYRVWLLPSQAVFGTFTSLQLSYSTATDPLPDNWVVAGSAFTTAETKVYGSRSLRADSGGYVRQSLKVLPNTLYQLSAQIKQSALPSSAYISIIDPTQSFDLARVSGSPTVADWTMVSVPFNSGANTSIYVQCANFPGTGTVWFDAVKLEASPIVTPWAPALVGAGAIVDTSGIRVDASIGGTLRLRGSVGGALDVVTMGTHGLQLGTSEVHSGAAFPTSPALNTVFYRNDIAEWFFWDGVRWMSTTIYRMMTEVTPTPAIASPATLAVAVEWPLALGYGGSDIRIVRWGVSQYVTTTNDGTRYWTVYLYRDPSLTLIDSYTTAAMAPNTWTRVERDTAALVGGSDVLASIRVTSTGAVGNMNLRATIDYRKVAV